MQAGDINPQNTSWSTWERMSCHNKERARSMHVKNKKSQKVYSTFLTQEVHS